MFGRIALVTVVAVVGINVALVTIAQDEPVEGPRRPTLGERLQRFKQELIGDEAPVRRQPTLRELAELLQAKGVALKAPAA